MNIVVDKNLFAAWCGMIAGGYNLADIEDKFIFEVIGDISKIDFDISIREYFSYTRTDTVSVNPYYPRGSDLSVACLFLDRSIGEYIDFLEFCKSPDADNYEFYEWILKLPYMLKKICGYEEIKKVWVKYADYVQRKFRDILGHIAELQVKLNRLNWTDSIEIVLIPNLLQSKFLSDFAFIDNALFVISSEFSDLYIVHEYLHIILKQKRTIILDILNQSDIERFICGDKMRFLGYTDGDTEESKADVLEECIIRALSAAISDGINAEEYCKMCYENGFIAVPEMFSRLKNLSVCDMELDELLYKIADI